MSDEYSQCVKIESADGKRTVEQFIHNMLKKANEGQQIYGTDIQIKRVQDPEDGEEDPTPSSSD